MTTTYWTDSRILAAIKEWVREHGEPPRAKEWARATPTTPDKWTASRAFGSWNAAIEAAGFASRPAQAPGPWLRWDKDRVASAFLDFLLVHGRWPTVTDCGRFVRGHGLRDPSLPAWGTVYRVFGSFGDAKRYAGWDETSRCGRCGCDRDERTIGCKACTERYRARRYRAALKSGARPHGAQAIPRVDPLTTPGAADFAPPTREAATAARRAA